MGFCRRSLNTVDGIFRNTVKIYLLALHSGRAAIQLGKVDDILHQSGQTQGLLPDLMGKGLDILLLHHTVFHQFSIAGNCMQRGLELVGNIRSELLTDLRAFFQLILILTDLCLLERHTPQQRLNFGVFLPADILTGFVQVQRVDGFHNSTGKAGRQEEGQHQCQQ